MYYILHALRQAYDAAILEVGSNLSGIKRTYIGDPIKIPESNLPCLTIQPIETEYIQRGTTYDQKNHQVEIRLVYNARVFFEQPTNYTTDGIVYAVLDATSKAEKPTTNYQEISDTSIAGVIEATPFLPYNDGMTTQNTASHSRVVNIRYEFSEKRAFPSFEVVVTTEILSVGNRLI